MNDGLRRPIDPQQNEPKFMGHERCLIVAHDDPGVGAADKRAAIEPNGIRLEPAMNSPQPVFDPKIVDPREFTFVVGHHSEA